MPQVGLCGAGAVISVLYCRKVGLIKTRLIEDMPTDKAGVPEA